jgi:hypothetical protein
MSRADLNRLPAESLADRPGGEQAPIDSAKTAEEIGIAALDLAKRARDAGLTTISHLLETIALEAGAEASAMQWRVDIVGK